MMALSCTHTHTHTVVFIGTLRNTTHEFVLEVFPGEKVVWILVGSQRSMERLLRSHYVDGCF